MNCSKSLKTSTLLVPMRVHAMMVGASPVPTIFTNLTDDFTKIKMNPLGDLVPSELMSDKSTEHAGVHLHWFIPKGLRQGIQNTTNDLPLYPRVPNRFIVSRCWSIQGETGVKVKHWVIESDVLQRTCSPEKWNDDSCSYPYLQDSQLPYRFLGRSYPYGERVPLVEEKIELLTTINSGNPAFSVVHAYSRNVFGFCDDLLDEDQKRLVNANLSYSVRGYYEGEELVIANAEECLSLYNWKASEDATFPAKPVLHGFLANLSWQNDATDYNSAFMHDLNNPKISIGNNSTEALLALKSRSLKHENVLKVLMQDKLHVLTTLNGDYKSKDTEHELRFMTKTEEKTYTLQSMIKSKDYSELPDIPVEGVVYFQTLKRLEGERAGITYELEALKSQMNDLWSKYVLKSLIVFPQPDKEAAQKWMKVYENKLYEQFKTKQDLVSHLDELERQIEFWINRINEVLVGQYCVDKTAGDRFYEPNAPVLLLSGVERGHLYSPKNESGQDDPLICRTVEKTLEYLPIAFRLRGTDYTVNVKRSELLKPDDTVGPCSEVLLEACLFFGCKTEEILEFIIKKIGLKEITTKEKADLTNLILETQQKPFEEAGKIYPDSVAMYFWEGMIWQPVLLCWRGSYYPDQTLLTNQPTLNNWELKGADYAYKGQPITTEQSVTFEGRILLTPQITDLLYDKAKNYFSDGHLTNLKSLNELGILSQVLDSFNDRFLMSQLSIRFPATIYKNGNQDLANAVRKELADFNIEKPVFNSFFSPLWGGFFKFDKLRLVGTFGEFQNIECKSMAITEDLNPNKEQQGSYVMLPPRFMQATKLQFDFIDARTNEPCDFSLKSSPICGWVMPNHIDQSLMLYDDEGQMVGSLVVTGFKKHPVMLRAAAGKSVIPLMQKELQAFVDEILSRSERQEDVLTPLLKVIDSSFCDIQRSGGSQSVGLSLYVGRPLALVRASFSVIQEGPPAQYKMLESQSKKPIPIPNTSIEKFQMPLFLGEKENLEDGVIGFFLQAGDKTYTHFNSSFVTDEESNYFIKNSRVNVPMSISGEERSITLLLDPLQNIHLSSGMLPTRVKRIPQNRIENALNNLYLTLYSGPLLVGKEPYVLPFTNLPDRNWSMLVPLGDDQWYETSELYPANGNAFLAKEPFGIVEGYMKLKAGEKYDDD